MILSISINQYIIIIISKYDVRDHLIVDETYARICIPFPAASFFINSSSAELASVLFVYGAHMYIVTMLPLNYLTAYSINSAIPHIVKTIVRLG